MALASSTLLKALLTFALFFLLFTHAPTCSAETNLFSGETLNAGESLDYGAYQFIMQEDCNLVLYDSGNPVWASDTGGRSTNCHVTLQSDGNLVVYTQDNTAIWAANSVRGEGYYVLILQRDRNVVTYGGAIWATNTHVDVVNRNGGMMSLVIINAPKETNNGTTNLIKTVV